jgi:hypothetical protein
MRNERGGGRIGLVLWLAVLAAGVFAALRIVPVKIAVMELHDFADAQTLAATLTPKPDEAKLAQLILNKAKALDVPLTKKQIQVDSIANELHVRMRHDVKIDLVVYEWDWTFDKTFSHTRY